MSDKTSDKTETTEPTRCILDGDFITPCIFLEKTLRYGNGVGRLGLFLRPYFKMRTGEKTRDLLIINSGELKKKGAVANFCPFCGRALLPEYKNIEALDIEDNPTKITFQKVRKESVIVLGADSCTEAIDLLDEVVRCGRGDGGLVFTGSQT